MLEGSKIIMRNASLVYFLPDLDDGSGRRFLDHSGRDRLDHILYPYMHTNAVTTVRTYNAQSRFAAGLDEYANDIYCKTIVAVGKALYGENLRQVLKNLRVPVDHPQSALPENAHADYARLNHRLHLIAVPDWQSALALGDTLDSYFDLLAGDRLAALSRQIGALLRKRSWSIATAESCTGGAIVKSLTDVSGSSDYVRGGACTYTAEAKERVLGVPPEVIAAHGIVSAETAQAMAQGAQKLYASDIALATTGVAGPGPDADGNPEGLVYVGLAVGESCVAYKYTADAHIPLLDRAAIRTGCVRFALEQLRNTLPD